MAFGRSFSGAEKRHYGGSMKVKPMEQGMEKFELGLPPLRLEIPAAARVLRMSRAQVYNRIQSGALRVQKDGARTFVLWTELQRYVQACEGVGSGGV